MKEKFWFILIEETMEVMTKPFKTQQEAMDFYNQLTSREGLLICETIYG